MEVLTSPLIQSNLDKRELDIRESCMDIGESFLGPSFLSQKPGYKRRNIRETWI
jgi:hypothetical protein